MKQYTQTIYTVDELTEDARNNAHSTFISDDHYTYNDDNEKTLNKFLEIFDMVKVQNWEYGYNTSIYFSLHCENEEVEDLKGVRLATYIYNNFYEYITKGKFYCINKTGLKTRHSKIIIEKDNCPLTGYYLDYNILKPIFEFLQKPNNTTFYELIEKCLNGWADACQNDYENYYSMESFIETSNANDWHYSSNGKFIGSFEDETETKETLTNQTLNLIKGDLYCFEIKLSKETLTKYKQYKDHVLTLLKEDNNDNNKEIIETINNIDKEVFKLENNNN